MTHRDITSSDRGILKEILTQSYQSLQDLNEPPWIPGDGMWQDYDDRIFDNLAKSDECVFLTESDHTVVGFASFTCKESEATIGRNSVLPKHGGKGNRIQSGCGDHSEVHCLERYDDPRHDRHASILHSRTEDVFESGIQRGQPRR